MTAPRPYACTVERVPRATSSPTGMATVHLHRSSPGHCRQRTSPGPSGADGERHGSRLHQPMHEAGALGTERHCRPLPRCSTTASSSGSPQANLALGRLDGVIRTVPDPDFFVAMYVRQEAVLSSQIEGTQTTLE